MNISSSANWLASPLLAASLSLVACKGASAEQKRQRPPPMVLVKAVEVRDVPVEIRAPIDLRPSLQADIGSKIVGYLSTVLVDRGDRVRAGQLLAVVRPSDLPEQLQASRGVAAQAQASSALARTNLERSIKLAPNGIVSQQELQQAQTAFATAEANRAAVESQVSAIAVRLGETRITAPIDGVISDRRADPGALVGLPQSGPILTVQSDDPLRAYVSLNERDAPRVRLNQLAYVELDAFPGRRIEGRVARLAPSFDYATRTLEAEVQLPNHDHQLRTGMYGRGSVVLETHAGAKVIPTESLLFFNSQPFVFVIEGDHVRRQSIQLGVDGGSWVEVVEGLAANAQVVTAGGDGLGEGSRVRVASNAEPSAGPKATR